MHDVCSAVHPMAVGLPRSCTRSGSSATGCEWRWPESTCAHPLDDGSAGVMLRSIEDDRGRRSAPTEPPGGGSSAGPARSFDVAQRGHLCARPAPSPPPAPPGRASGCPPRRRPPCSRAPWRTPQARALFGGVAAHAYRPLNRPMSSSVGMALICACHRFGWAGRRGRLALDHRRPRRRICASTAARSRPACRCSSLSELPDADAVVLDLAPGGRRRASPASACPPGSRAPTAATATAPAPSRSTSRSRAASPGRNEACRRAGTVHVRRHLRGDRRGRARRQPRPDARAPLRAGRPAVPGRPRALGGRRAPDLGLRPRAQRLRRRRRRTRSSARSSASPRACASASSRPLSARPREIEAANANYVGGDIITGANTPGPDPDPPPPRRSTPTHRHPRASTSARPRRRPAPASTE